MHTTATPGRLRPAARPWLARCCCAALLLALLCGCAGGATAAPPPWAEQLALLQERSRSVAPDAELYRCSASLIAAAQPEPQQPLRLRCAFIRPDGELIDFVYEDTALPGSLRPGIGSGWLEGWSAADSDYARQAVPAVAITARQALAIASPSGQRFTTPEIPLKFGGVVLFLDARVQAAFGVPAAWSVLYTTMSNEEWRVWVDARTGAILAEHDNATLFPSD